MASRSDGRRPDELRPVNIITNYQNHPTGSCLIEMGRTRVICSAVMEETVPPFLKNTGKGWLSAEYAMLPGSTNTRAQRERQKVGGRTHEIQRLIGRSLRNCVDLSSLGERSILLDCDVLDADGGTRTAAITGSYVALMLALRKIKKANPTLNILEKPAVAAVSVGIVRGVPSLDLHYEDDRDAEVDMNVVKTAAGKYVEVQGTAENAPFDRANLDKLLALADQGIEALFLAQKKALQL